MSYDINIRLNFLNGRFLPIGERAQAEKEKLEQVTRLEQELNLSAYYKGTCRYKDAPIDSYIIEFRDLNLPHALKAISKFSRLEGLVSVIIKPFRD